MNIKFYLTVLLCCVIACLKSQCDTGSEPECTCETAEVLCSVSELDGFSGSMSSFQHPNDGPDNFCPPSGLFTNNPTWFAFIAWCEDITMEIEYENCTMVGGFIGAQLAVYTDCSWDEQVDCDSQCENNSTVSIDMQGLTIGESYYVMLDGCNGSACDFEISVSPTDCDEFIEEWDDPVTEDLVVCIGQGVSYDVENLSGATNWHWYIDGEEVEITASARYDIVWGEEGTYELCVDVSNICLEVDEEPQANCVMITVGNPDAGEIDINDSPECPNEIMEISVSDYNMSDTYEQYLIIVDMEGEVVQVISGNPIYDFTWPSCGVFTVYSLNFPEGEEVEVPGVGDDYFGSDCMFYCCDENSSTLEFVDEDAPEFEDEPRDITIDCHLLLEELDLDDIESIDTEDNCAESVEILGIETVMADTCNGGIIVREWMYADDCGNEVVHTQTISILPLGPASFINPPSDTAMSNLEFENYTIQDLQYSNGQMGSCSISGMAMPIIEDNRSDCGGFVLINYSYTDFCGRKITASQRIDIITDVMATDTTLNICDFNQLGFVILERSMLDSLISNDTTGVSISYYRTELDLEMGTNELSFPFNSMDLPEQAVYADVVDGAGCRSEIIISISINPIPVLELSAMDESCLGLMDGQVSIISPASLSSYILLQNGDSISSNVVYDLDSGTYVFHLIDSLSCSVSDSVLIGSGIMIEFIDFESNCNINGTGTDDSDDYYEVSFVVSGGSGTYQLDVGTMVNQGVYNYDELVSLSLPADGNSVDFVAMDSQNGCVALLTTPVLQPCSNQCALSLDFLDYTCNDNGTPLDGVDDYYEFSINVTAINQGTTNAYDIYIDDVLSYSFNYNQLSMFQLPATGLEVSIRIEDEEKTACGLDLMTEVLTACSNLCQISINILSVVCLDPGTPSTNDDDLYEVELIVEGINASDSFILSGGIMEFAYGESHILGNNLISDGDLNITAFDSEDSACFDEATAQAPAPCSAPCELQIQDLSILDCNDNMTGMDSSDDYFYVELQIDSILGSGTEYNLIDGQNIYGPFNYNEFIQLGPLRANGNEIILELVDDFNASCVLEFIVSQNPCSECQHSLDLSADIMTLNCRDVESNIESMADAPVDAYQWTGPNGFSQSTAGVNVNSAGVYNLLVTYDDGCQVEQSIVIEESLDTPVSNAGADQFLNCEIESVVLSAALSQYGSNVLISWIDAAGNEISNQTEISVDQAGTYGLFLYDTENFCESEIDYVIVEEFLNEPTAIIYAEPTNILDCNIMSIRLTYEEEENTEYNWLINNQLIQREEIIIEEPQEVGLIAIDTISECTSETSLNIVDFEVYPDIVIENIEELDCITELACVTVSTNAANDIQYSWYDDNGTLLSNDAMSYCFDAAGTYTVEIVDIENGCENTQSFEVQAPIMPEVSLPATLTIVNDLTLDVNAVVNVDESFIQNISWQTEATLSCYDCFSTTILAVQDSTVVTVTVTTIEGCEDSSELLILVERIPKIYIPNIFSQERGVYFTVFSSSDIDRIDALIIYDRWGNLIFSNNSFEPNEPSQGWDGTRDGRSVEQGVYVYYLEYTVNGRKEKTVGSVTLIK